MSANVASIIAAIGASGTGKGLFVTERARAYLGRGRRAFPIWSPLEATDRYGEKFGAAVVRSVPELVAKLKARQAVVFVPDLTGRRIVVAGRTRKLIDVQFELFCRAVWYTPGAVALIEELSRVTSPSYAPPAWQNLTTAGRHQGLTIMATAQRPAQIDKDFLGNCTEVRAYRVSYVEDARALASVMRERPEVFLELPDRHYRHRWIRELRTVEGVQALPGQASSDTAVQARARVEVKKKTARRVVKAR